MIRGKFLLSGDPLCEHVFDIRRRVFTDEMGLFADTDVDENDRMAVYALILDDDGTPSGTGRLYIDGDSRFAIGRVCVLKEARRRYMGDLIMRMLLYRAEELNCASVTLTSPLDAVAFFARYGLRAEGEVFEEAGVPCRRMTASREEINLEGTCSKGGACAGCSGNCEACADKQ